MCRLWVLMALVLAVPAGAQLAVDVTDSGAVNIDVGGARCQDSFQVILPAPGWKGGAGPSDCTRETLGPGHVRVRGQMTDGRPCASLTLDAQETDGAAELTWELRFSRDLNGVTLDFSRPGKPTDNGLIEAFNGRLRAECLNEHWFLALADAQEKLDARREDSNGQRPHGALKTMTPEQFAQQARRGHPPGGDQGSDDTAGRATGSTLVRLELS